MNLNHLNHETDPHNKSLFSINTGTQDTSPGGHRPHLLSHDDHRQRHTNAVASMRMSYQLNKDLFISPQMTSSNFMQFTVLPGPEVKQKQLRHSRKEFEAEAEPGVKSYN